MRVIRITSTHDSAQVAACLEAAGTEPLGRCSIGRRTPHHLLVADADGAVRTLRRHGIRAIEVHPPLPTTRTGVLWWKAWRETLPLQTYAEFRSLYHSEVRSRGSLIRVRTEHASRSEHWRILADAGVDIRCESYCNLPTGDEFHLLVPDADRATAALQYAGVHACKMDYAGPRSEPGVSWWGEWKPALAYARRLHRLLLLSFASPRVEQVPGIW